MILHVNGRDYELTVETDRSLLYVLRDDLNLTGTKYGCGEAACGACKVLVNGIPVASCITPAHSMTGKQITTIEGLETDGRLHPVQQAFLSVDTFQCSFCASGMIMTAVALLKKNPRPSDDAIAEAMNGNICRCGVYPYIIRAIKLASKSS